MIRNRKDIAGRRIIAGTLASLLLTGAALLPLSAQAHRGWILPAATTLSSEDAWVTFDAAISNDIFHTDYAAMRLNSLTVAGPDGEAVEVHNAHTGKYRSTFDLNLVARGTYRITSNNSGIFATWEENGERKRWRGNVAEMGSALPDNAENLQVTEFSRRLETFVTAGAPDNTVFDGDRSGLTLQPDTHPNDLFDTETARFRFLIDGEPAAGVEMEVIPAGMRYRNAQDMQTLTTDEEGYVEITWQGAGMYWLGASYSDDKASIPGARRNASYSGTFEVLPE
ncbi:MAG: DUF4198 domain-containing protein [Alcanivorax sp.]|nr:DUF4198 domain-containing protein [Alcanivorax sp.]